VAVPFAKNADREDGTCGLPEDPETDQPAPPRGTAGAATVQVSQPDGTQLWQFDVIRPSASSGYWGSGIELKNVTYKGVRVLKHANVPIFNVQYLNDACGPYRDWAYEENRFTAKVKTALVGDAGSGIAETEEMPQTILQSGTDFGNYYGVAIYTDENQNTTLMTEMAAGWYRYVMMWVLGADGSIAPRFGFGAVENACVCNRHFHHAYWRFEFDLGGKNQFQKQVTENGPWVTADAQDTFTRQPGVKYRVLGASGITYAIEPGPQDGSADQPKQPGTERDAFAKSDMWVMNAKDNQMDDSALSSESSEESGDSIKISQFLKAKAEDQQNEKLTQDGLVVWYGAHFIHDIVGEAEHPEANEGPSDHIVGPMIRQIQN
jgi:hypothetical protein